MSLIISPAIQSKLLKRHDVTARDVEECFGRSLKIVFVQNGEDVFLKTAYGPNAEELRIYRKFGQ